MSQEVLISKNPTSARVNNLEHRIRRLRKRIRYENLIKVEHGSGLYGNFDILKMAKLWNTETPDVIFELIQMYFRSIQPENQHQLLMQVNERLR